MRTWYTDCIQIGISMIRLKFKKQNAHVVHGLHLEGASEGAGLGHV